MTVIAAEQILLCRFFDRTGRLAQTLAAKICRIL